MAMNTYVGIQDNVRKWTVVDTTVIANTDIDDMLFTVEQTIWENLRVPEMRSYYTVAYPAGGIDISVMDSGFVQQLISVAVTNNASDIQIPDPGSEFLVRMALSTVDVNNPRLFGWLSEADGTSKLVIAPEPTGKTVHISYWRRFASLSSATNLAFLAYPAVWLNGLVAESFLLQQDPELYQLWTDKFMKSIESANRVGRGRNESLQGNTPRATLTSWKP